MHLGAQDEQCFASVDQGAPQCGNSCASINARLWDETPLVKQLRFVRNWNGDKLSMDMERFHYRVRRGRKESFLVSPGKDVRNRRMLCPFSAPPIRFAFRSNSRRGLFRLVSMEERFAS